MDAETLKWITGIIIGNVTFATSVVYMLKVLLNRAKHTEDKMDQSLVELKTLQDSKKEQARSQREMVFYMQWFVEKMSGEKPPPYVDKRT